MSTFLIMQSRIADDLVRDDLGNQIKNAINDAIELQEGERYKFNEKRYTLLTVAGQEYYDLDDGTLLTSAGGAVATGEILLEVDDIFVTINNSTYPLVPRTQQHVNEWQSTTYQGQPADYTIYGQQLRVWPVPDAEYTLNLMGLGRLGSNPLTADADTNAWMTDGAAIIRAQAKMLLYRDVLRDAEGYGLAQGQLVEAQAAAKRKMAAQAFTGTQKAWSL